MLLFTLTPDADHNLHRILDLMFTVCRMGQMMGGMGGVPGAGGQPGEPPASMESLLQVSQSLSTIAFACNEFLILVDVLLILDV